jgi:xanthine/CO dehydrogenase XdhC/CoxF family maturation factor
MRTTTVILVAAAFALGGLVGAYALLMERPLERGAVAGALHPAWSETPWPFPMDQWGKGKAFRCRPSDCGGEVTVLIEPQPRPPLFCLVGAGHCSQSLAKLALECGFAVAVLDDREELLAPVYFPSPVLCLSNPAPEEFIKTRRWSQRDTLVLVSRNYQNDREALAAALEMIKSLVKVPAYFESRIITMSW